MNIPECWCCGLSASEKHHLKPQRHNGCDHWDNLVAICTACHDVVDCHWHMTKKQVERLAAFPKIQALMVCRMMADVYDRRAMAHVEQEVLKHAVRVLENPTNDKKYQSLKAATTELRVRQQRIQAAVLPPIPEPKPLPNGVPL